MKTAKKSGSKKGGHHKVMSWKQLIKEINEVRKDPEYMKEVDKFIKITSR
ncbi:MAG: hypothetical protein AABY09_02285 [Nanoarchaeota archaeon]